jgi:hypothetical protein
VRPAARQGRPGGSTHGAIRGRAARGESSLGGLAAKGTRLGRNGRVSGSLACRSGSECSILLTDFLCGGQYGFWI